MRRFLVWMMACLVLLGAVSGVRAETVPGDLEARLGNMPSIEYQGTLYRMRRRLTSVLLAGTDQRQDDAPAVDAYRSGGQADFLLLLVFDDNRCTIQPVHINRDLMAEITVLNVMGRETGTRMAQICLAHGFGDGGEQSCRLLARALSKRLLDIPIDHYAAMSMDGIAVFNDALGGVQVTLEDDFSALDAQMTPGTTLRLNGRQAELFTRQRYFVGDQTNASRMRRQQVYMRAAADELQNKISESPSFVSGFFSMLDPYLVTDMNRGRMINLANLARQYEMLPVLELEGETVQGEGGFIEFYPADESVMRTVLEAFYAPVS